ncbi:MAG: hypothetical protein SGI83_12995 [Bacteroidota bacterium]|nr:hypothetical protein [Bacteroidota bacterium]
MLRNFYKHLLVIACCVLFAQYGLQAQNLTGIWRGYFITNMGEKYKLEFQVNIPASNFSSGVSYSYLDVRFYGKATMTGSFNKSSNNLKIREIKTVEIKNMDGSGACIMNYDLFYSQSGKEEFLEGTFLGKPEVKGKTNPYSWGDCGGGKVFLRKVTTSDFYVEPFLRGKINTAPVIYNKPPVKKDTLKTKTIIPTVNKPVVTTKPPVNIPIVKTNPPVIIKPKTDTTTKIKINTPPFVKTNPTVAIPQPAVLKNRSNEVMKTLLVSNLEVTVKLYDNGEIDDDTISVYLDNKLMLSSKRLTATPLIITFKLDDDNAEHALTMVAENLGRIPPNTSLMVVESGEQRFDVRITSTEQKNAVVRFRYQKPN